MMKIIGVASAILISLASVACGQQNQEAYNTTEYDRQSKKYWEQVEETDRQSEATDRQLELAAKQAERFEALLDKWEEQAARQDRILSEQERRLGIKRESQQGDSAGTP